MLNPRLSFTLLPDRKHEMYEVPDGSSLEDELDSFLSRTGHFEFDWIEVRGGGHRRFIRYDQIIEVSADFRTAD